MMTIFKNKLGDTYADSSILPLRRAFISKIKLEWDSKWAKTHGSSFDFSKLKSQNAFLDDIVEDIEQTLKKKIGLEETAKILISKDSLRRIFNNEKANSWQEKTKNTLSYYVGYDGWEDFKNKQVEHPPIPTNTHISKKKLLAYVSGFLFILVALAAGLAYKNRISHAFLGDKKSIKFEIQDLYSETYPASLFIEYDLSGIKYQTAHIMIDHEKLQYILQPNRLATDTGANRIPIYFFTPGIKHISLEIDGKIVKKIAYIVSTGNKWYGCARVKEKTVPNPFLNGSKKLLWYGEYNSMAQNSENNFITPPSVWNSYINASKEEEVYPNQELHFPDSELNQKSSFSRVAFLKAGNFNIAMDSMTISFRAKHPNVQGEDCLSFMFQCFDEESQGFELYSSAACQVETNLSLNHENSYRAKPEINSILNDSQWHSFEFILANNIISVKVDGKQFIRHSYVSHYKKLSEIWFIFEGNGYVDDVKLSNSISKKVIFEDDFSH